jgi:hypothetical protein
MRRRFSRLRWLVLLVVVYAVLWLVTLTFGTRDVRTVRLRAMYQPMGLSGFTDVSDGSSAKWPWYYCRTVSYAPFVVRVDHGWQTGGLSGDGGSELYLWAFGVAVKAYEIEHWAN